MICVDATHSTNMYDFLLITVLVIDEFGEGAPAAWAISNKEDTATLSVFLKHMKSRSGDINPKFFMSDDTKQYWNAWRATYGGLLTKKILCAWHVDKNWRKAIREHIHSAEDQALLYHQLQVLLKETDKPTFHVELQQFMTVIMDKHPSFSRYFSDHYAGRTCQWATCERIGMVANTNMHIESFHRLLKVVYLEGKQNRRLARLLSVILKISRNKAFERFTKLHKGKNSHRMREMNKRHKSAEELMLLGMQPMQQSATQWAVKSLSMDDMNYTIHKCSHDTCECRIICKSCQLCVHMYSCSCVDYALHFTACKHIHLVHMVVCNTTLSHVGLNSQVSEINDQHLALLTQPTCSSESGSQTTVCAFMRNH